MKWLKATVVAGVMLCNATSALADTEEDTAVMYRLSKVESDIRKIKNEQNNKFHDKEREIVDIERRINYLEDELSQLVGMFEEMGKTIKDLAKTQEIQKNILNNAAERDALSPYADADISHHDPENITDQPTVQNNKNQTSQKNANEKLDSETYSSIADEEAAAYEEISSTIQQGNLEAALAPLNKFVQNYSDSKLLPYAYYWLGEIYYSKKEYKQASIEYLKGYKADPKGKKAIDNAFRLGMSLKNSKNLEGACITLSAVLKDFKHIPLSISQTIHHEVYELRAGGHCPT